MKKRVNDAIRQFKIILNSLFTFESIKARINLFIFVESMTDQVIQQNKPIMTMPKMTTIRHDQ